MSKVCENHREHPVKIYDQCVGCELEWFREELKQKQQEIKRLEQERDKLIEGLRWYAYDIKYMNWPSELWINQGQRAREILREVGVTVE